MTWTIPEPRLDSTFASLGAYNGDIFTVSNDCLAILEEILQQLITEDCTLRTFRRAIGFGQNIRKDLIPLIINVKDDTAVTDASKIIDTAIKILVNLSIPVDYLLSLETISGSDITEHTVSELNKLLTNCKEAFSDSRSTKAIMDHIKYVVERDNKLTIAQCDSINNCLLLLRNILHIPDMKQNVVNNSLGHSSVQNQIIWNLFTQSVDKIIICLISCPQKMYWSVTIVQLIAVLYKDQHVGTLQKLLNLWLETSLSESSEDNESNTSPPEQGSDDSSPFVTSDPTSDSSDTGGSNDTTISKGGSVMKEAIRTAQNCSNKALTEMNKNQSTETETGCSSGISSDGFSAINKSGSDMSEQNNKRKCKSSQSEVSDCGYVTQVENQESISTSSNDDDQPNLKPVHQKPHTFQKTRYNASKNREITALERKELRSKKLVKRSKTNVINMKGLMHHMPTDENVSNILKEFTVDFLLKGYGSLVQDLYSQLLANVHLHIDKSHFFWLVTYFLKFATQLELDLEHINPVLSYDIMSYLVFQGVWLYEELEILSSLPNVDLKPCLRRLHLVVTAIREFMQTLEIYQKMVHLTDEDKENLSRLQLQIAETKDLRELFILLLRQYNPKIQSRQYLQDLILTNHNLLLFLENIFKAQNSSKFNIMEHLKSFATVDIMRQYGVLLENFNENGEFVNNCVFTMMHHIGGDLENVATLFQPSILKTFSQIWETDYEICDDWADLIEYVIHKFINTPRTHCSDFNNPTSHETIEGINISEVASPSSSPRLEVIDEEDTESLSGHFNQSEKSANCEDTNQNYEDNGVTQKSQIAIIKELLKQNIINEDQYNDFIKNDTPKKKPKSQRIQESNQIVLINDSKVDKVIEALKEFLIKENKVNCVFWLQHLLIEACYAKLILETPADFMDDDNIVEPAVYYYALLNLPIPVVPWTEEQHSILHYQPFILLLHKLGFYLPVDTGKIFVRIPNFWNADHIYSIAQQLGPINTANLKFDAYKLNGFNKIQTPIIGQYNQNVSLESGKFSLSGMKQTPSVFRYTPLTSQLSITIPDEVIPCSLPAPELTIASHPLTGVMDTDISCLLPSMDCSTINDDTEHNSTCDTASVASDLTRMCVSDEDDKIVLLIEQKTI